jgi:hypothetical protein
MRYLVVGGSAFGLDCMGSGRGGVNTQLAIMPAKLSDGAVVSTTG